jgi:hypothetical protein
MKRTMEITVINETDKELTSRSAKLIHGKWTDGIAPTRVIEPGEEGSINSQKETGAAYGTEGSCRYIIVDRTSNNPELGISWTKPYGHDASGVAAAIFMSGSPSLMPDSPYTATVETVSSSTESYVARVTVGGHGDPKRSISSWMTQNQDLLSSKRLSQICLPGSHDSGTFKVTHETKYGSARNTKTQFFNMEAQLMQGIRFFDLRPALYENDFYTAHYSHIDAVKLGYQGAIGVALAEAFEQIHSFVNEEQNKNELIILDFSHFIDWENRDTNPSFDAAQVKRFEDLIQEHLGTVLVQGVAGDLTSKTLDGLIHGSGAGRRNVIALSSSFAATDAYTRQGLWNAGNLNMAGEYSDTNELSKMVETQKESLLAFKRPNDAGLFQLCWQLTLSDAQSSVPGSASILDLAKKANPALFPSVDTWIAEGIIKKSVYPNVINTDACCEPNTRAVELALRICELVNL